MVDGNLNILIQQHLFQLAANNENSPNMLTSDQKMFVVLSKEKGINTNQIQIEFTI